MSVFGLFANLDQTEVSDCLDNEQNQLDTCQKCSINGFKLKTRPSNSSILFSPFTIIP